MRTGIAPGMACTGHSRPAAAISARCALAMPGIHSKFEHASTRATHPIGGVKTQFVLESLQTPTLFFRTALIR